MDFELTNALERPGRLGVKSNYVPAQDLCETWQFQDNAYFEASEQI